MCLCSSISIHSLGCDSYAHTKSSSAISVTSLTMVHAPLSPATALDDHRYTLQIPAFLTDVLNTLGISNGTRHLSMSELFESQQQKFLDLSSVT